MSHTAFSQQFGRELDVKQLLKLRNVIASVDTEDFGLSAQERLWIRADLLCPSCRCPGASLVRSDVAKGGRGNTRQAHFRFLDERGRTAHKIGCDFYALDDEPGFVRGVDVQFSANDKDTKVVRELVCKSISSGALKKTDIFDMRNWFLAEKDAHTFLVAASPVSIDWLYRVRRLPVYLPLAFAPVHLTLPGFSVRRATERHLAHHYLEFLKGCPSVPIDAEVRDRAKRLAVMHQGQPLLAISHLRPLYERAAHLASLMSELGALPLSKPSRGFYLWHGAPKALMAFSATLLFVSGWDLQAALARFSAILASPAPNDLSLGNVMGLNPFHDFAALEVLRFASTLPPETARTYDYAQEFAAVEHMIMQAMSDG